MLKEKTTTAARAIARLLAVGLACIAFVAGTQQARAQEPELAQGLRYVQALQRNLYLDIADAVLKELTAKFPEAAVRVAQLQLEADLMRGKFDEVKAQISAAEKEGRPQDVVWAMKLALADAYYAYARYDECSSIYEGFFGKYQKKGADGTAVADVPASLDGVFTDAAYKYAQMLIGMNRREKAIDMYSMLIARKWPADQTHIKRQCMGEKAELCIALADETKDKKVLAARLEEADKLADQLLWVRDLWFGKAIVFKAHVLMVRGKPEEAQRLVDTYDGALREIHNQLVAIENETGNPVVRQSPMAECRYLLALMQQERVQSIMGAPEWNAGDPKQKEEVISLLLGSKDLNTGKRNGKGAYNHFLNVYIKYPESAWAADAGERAEQVRTLLTETFGAKLTSNVTPEREAKVREVQYRDARALFRQGQINEAKGRLLQVLNSFPSCPEAVPALEDLARCYIQSVAEDANADLYGQTVTGHLAERFCDNPQTMTAAGDSLMRIGEYWGECGRPDMRHETYSKFFRLYPNHPSCVATLASFGEKAFQDKDYGHALDYYGIVANSYTNSPRALDALFRITTIHETTGDFDKLIPSLDEYIRRLKTLPKPPQALYSTRYRKANALRGRAIDTIRNSTNDTEVAKATRLLSLQIKEFDDLSKELADPPPSAQIDERERRQNELVREMALYNKAFALTQFPAKDEKTKNRMLELAIDAYEELIRSYPKGESAPTALIQIGTINMMVKKTEEAEAALSRLRRDYPDSEQAKSALPMIADSLMKLGEREGAVARYREMFSGNGVEYSDSDILRAATALIESKEYDLAGLAIEKVLARAEDKSPSRVQARFAQCRLLAAKKDNAGAVEKLKAFIDDYPNLQLMVDAYALLGRVASEAGLVEKDGKARTDYFNAAILATKEVRKRRTNDLERAQSDIDVGRIMANKAKAEAEFGSKETAREYRGQALVSYQGFIDSVGPDRPQLLPLAEIAYYEEIPLLMEHGMWSTAIENCNDYLSRFPQGRYIGQVNAWRNQSRIELGDGVDSQDSGADSDDAGDEGEAGEDEELSEEE